MGKSQFFPPPHSALIVVDVQRDFCPGGALGQGFNGDEVVDPLNDMIKNFKDAQLPIFFTRDFHPANMRAHFAKWPPHCVQGTPGSEFHPRLFIPETAHILSKGLDPDGHGYSGFDAVDSAGVQLDPLLQQLGVTALFIGGLCTDYCVKATVLDDRAKKYRVIFLKKCSRAVNVNPEDGEAAINEMVQSGIGVL